MFDDDEYQPLIGRYICPDCKGEKWKLFIAHDDSHTTRLIVVCANKKCEDNKKKELKVDDDAIVCWGNFDISNQGFDGILDEKETVLN